MEENGVKERIKLLAKEKRIPVYQLEDKLGVSKGYVGNIRKGIGADIAHKIINIYPDLNMDWLLTGKGEMLKPSQNINIQGSNNITGDDNIIIVNNGDNNSFPNSNQPVKQDGIIVRLLDTILARDKQIDKAQEQMDRLISLLEKKQGE